MDPSATTRIQVCGRLVAVLDGRRVEDELPSRQGRIVFAHLVIHRHRPASRSELIEAIWPDTAPAAAQSSLKSLLSKLRRRSGRK